MLRRTRAYVTHIARFPFATLPGWRHWYDERLYAGWRIQKHVDHDLWRLLDPGSRTCVQGSLEMCTQALAAQKARGLRPESAHFVLLIPGLHGSPVQLRSIERAVRRAGYCAMSLDFPSNREDIEGHAVRLRRVLDALEDVTCISFVTHSLGGLILRTALARNDGLPQGVAIGRILMMAPPHSGSFLADFVHKYPELDPLYAWVCGAVGSVLTQEGAVALPRLSGTVGIITADIGIKEIGDGLVACDSALSDTPDADSGVPPPSLHACRVTATHTTMLWSPEVRDHILSFLKDGRFHTRSENPDIHTK